MFLSFFKKITNSPKQGRLAQREQAVTAIAELPIFEALQQGTTLLIALGEGKASSYAEDLEYLHAIDAVNAPKLAQLTADLFVKREVDRKLLATSEASVYPYCKRLFLEMVLMAEKMHTELAHGHVTHHEFAVHLCKTLNVGLNIIKWRHFDDQPAPTVTWSNLHRLFQFAENSSVLYTRVRLYDADSHKVDFASIYLTCAMLNTMHLGNFTAKEIHLASSLLPVWMQSVSIEKSFIESQHQYYLDLNITKGADRVREPQEAGNGRYWKTADMVQRIDAYLTAMRENTLPKTSSILMHGSIESLYRLFKKLSIEWSVTHYKRQRRKVSRTSVDKKVFATYGLAQICDYLALYDKAHPASLKRHLTEDAQKLADELSQVERALLARQPLHVVDESYNGFGVDLGKAPIAYMQVGHLIGCWHPSIPNQYVVAEIKSVRKQKNGHYRAGLQIISSQSILIKLSKLERNTVALSEGFYMDDGKLVGSDTQPKMNGLLIPSHDGLDNTLPSLIIPREEYQQHRHFSFLTNGDEKTVEIGLPLAKQADWVRASIVSIH
jgi:hypothetical protein